MRSLRLLPLVLVVAAAGSGTAAGSGGLVPARVAPPHILYVSDWSGPSQIYSYNLNGGATGQVTFGRAPACLPGTPCGYVQPAPSPDGRRLLFWDHAVQGDRRSRLFVARADGRGRRQLAEIRAAVGNATWAPGSRRIAYGAASGVFVVNADGSGRRRVHRYGDALVRDRFAWSPDGRTLAILHGGDLVLVRGSTRRVVARKVDDFAWSPSGDRLAYLAEGLFLARPDGSRPRRLASSAQQHPYGLEWSSTGRWLAHNNGQSLRIFNVRTRRTQDLDRPRCCAEPAWSPDGRWLAYDEVDRGVTMVNAATGRIRRPRFSEHASALAWSPIHKQLAYVVALDGHYPTGDVRVVTPNGYGPATIIAAAGDLGGHISALTFFRPPLGTSYRRPAKRSLATVRRSELVAPSPIQRLATDGGHVAYTSCGRVFRWTPSTRELIQAEAVASLSPQCTSETYWTSQVPFGLAIAGNRVVHGSVYGSSSKTWWLGGTFVEGESAFTLGAGSMTMSSNFASYGTLVGDPVGAGDLLVFSTWNRDKPGGPCCVVSEQALLRAEPSGCPCPEISAEPGPFVPFDVNDGRVAAGGDNELILLDGTGAQLLRVPVRALAAQLHGRDLVVLVRGQLRHHDAATGALVAAWPLPDVSSGAECTAPGGRECARPSFVLQDAARGLVAYVLDGQVHVLRLADGRDAVVARGTLARFLDEGLVYADGARLRVVPFAALPV